MRQREATEDLLLQGRFPSAAHLQSESRQIKAAPSTRPSTGRDCTRTAQTGGGQVFTTPKGHRRNKRRNHRDTEKTKTGQEGKKKAGSAVACGFALLTYSLFLSSFLLCVSVVQFFFFPLPLPLPLPLTWGCTAPISAAASRSGPGASPVLFGCCAGPWGRSRRRPQFLFHAPGTGSSRSGRRG